MGYMNNIMGPVILNMELNLLFYLNDKSPAKPLYLRRRANTIDLLTVKDGKYVPYPGVVWVYPATKNNPQETTVSL